MRGTAILVAVALAAVALSTSAFANGARIVGTGDGEITVELATDDYALERVVHGGESFVRVTRTGYGSTTEPGLPSLPLEGVLIGLPFGADVALEVVSVESENLGSRRIEPTPQEDFVRDGEFAVPTQDYEPSPEFYAGRGVHPAGVASLGFDTTLRNQRVVQIIFHPFQYSAATGELTLQRRIVVRVRFDENARSPRMRPTFTPEPHWDAVLAGTVLNYRQALEWRARPEPRHAEKRADFRQDHESYRVEIGETGMYRLDFADLASAGLPATLGVDTVAVFQRSYDGSRPNPFVETPVPVVVIDADQDEVFDGSDYVVFHGLSFFDQHVVQGYEDRYETGNVYWFGWGDSLAARMDARAGWLGATGLTPPASFRDTLRFEEDVYFDATPPTHFVDYYHWTDYTKNSDVYQIPFSLYDIDPAEGMVLTARYQGMNTGTHRIDFSVRNGASQENDIGYFQFTGESSTMNDHIYLSGSIPAAYFTDGQNLLITEGSLGSYGSAANLDWLSWSYLREYQAHDGRLRFTNARLSGTRQFEVGGFADADIRAFDVTHPWSPVELSLQAENVAPDGGGYKLVLQDVVADYTRYEAASADALLEPVSVERHEPANLYASEADLIVVSYDGFASTMEALVSRRESEGFVVAHALLSEVYDEFGGGLPGPQALRNFFDYAFGEWERQPQFVLLVGDASEDTKGLSSSSSPNFMPTYLYTAGDDRIVASDQWYIRDNGPYYLPQMFIGRLPASGNAQLSNFISKIVTYENYSGAAAWRNNVLFIADDLWSYATLESPYSKKSYESEFTDVSVELSDLVASSPAGIDTTNFFLRRYTDPYHGSHTSEPIYPYAVNTANWVRTQGPRADLLEMIADGAAIVNFEGHGNRTQLTHEQLLMASVQTSLNDMPALANDSKPFVFLGFSCELARFHDYREGTSVDCVMEQMMQRDGGRGAVATFACSSVAFLTPNSLLHRKVYEAFFADPTPEGDGAYFWPRWSLGGTLAKGTIKYLASSSYPTLPQTYLLFGDPLMHVEMSPPRFKVTVDGAPHVNGDFLAASEADITLVADIIDEVEIDPASIRLEETDTGVVDSGEYALEAIGDTLGDASRWYRLTYVAPVREWSYDIKLSATDMNGAPATFTLHVAEGQQVLIRDVANHPNPFSDETSIIYLLNQEGADVRIRVFTVGGRLIRVIDDAPGNLNYNQVLWDGKDQEGDTVASGVYLYVIDVKGSDGSTATSPVGRMARIGGMKPAGESGRRR